MKKWLIFLFLSVASLLIAQTSASHGIRIEIKEGSLLGIVGGTSLSENTSYIMVGPADGYFVVRYTTINREGILKKLTVQSDAPKGALHIEVFWTPSTCGWPTTEVVATGDPQAIIDHIPSCFTGLEGIGVTYWFIFPVQGTYTLVLNLVEE